MKQPVLIFGLVLTLLIGNGAHGSLSRHLKYTDPYRELASQESEHNTRPRLFQMIALRAIHNRVNTLEKDFAVLQERFEALVEEIVAEGDGDGSGSGSEGSGAI